MVKKFLSLVAVPILVLVFVNGQARGAYQEKDAFLGEVFAGDPPKAGKIWIKKELKQRVSTILGHDLGALRVRYWRRDGRSAWILEEIGKEQPITVGIVINQEKIESIKVLEFRESRGWEVRYPFFTDQFKGAVLVRGDELDKEIDGISGATLSVNALKKVARLALLLDEFSGAGNGDDQQ